MYLQIFLHVTFNLSISCPGLIYYVQFLPYFFSYFPGKPNLEKKNYSNKFFHNFHLSKSSFTCPGLRASGLAQRLLLITSYAGDVNKQCLFRMYLYHMI